MTMVDPAQRPYAYAAEEWRDAGWSPLPLPPHAKWPPPDGFTGYDGADADAQQVSNWIIQQPEANLALRMPRGVCGIDVDAYKDEGAKSWKTLQERNGPLPLTWTLTSRVDGVSGIRLYRIPTDVKLRGVPEPGIEAIQFHHRYATAWPSVHPEGRLYRLIGPDGDENCPLPRPEELPELPAPWLEDLREIPRPAGVAAPKRHVGDWSTAVLKVYGEANAGMTKGSRHDTARDAVAALARLEVQHHPGATDAIDNLGARFTAEIQDRATPQQADKEWNDLLTGARDLVAATPSYRDSWDDLTSSGLRPAELIGGTNGSSSNVHRAALKLLTPVLPDDFWTARPIFEHIRQAAHARIRAADFVLGCVLARVAAYSDHSIEIPAIVGSAGSLNFYIVGIGHSGAGKSTSATLASELVPRPSTLSQEDVADNMPLGSGEGLAELYMGTRDETDENGKKKQVRKQVRHNAFVYGDEGAALNNMMERRGATLPEALRRGWTGADLGQANASADRTRVIHAGSYRLGLVVAFQPELAGRLLADADAGTPQRFIWLSATDPNIPNERVDWPGPLNIPTITKNQLEHHKETIGVWVRHPLHIDPTIVTELQADARAKARGDMIVGQLDGHEPLHRLKLAALFALLDGRLDINVEDWQLSKVIWTTSCQVRTQVAATVAAGLERTESQRIEQHARRELVAEAARRSAPAQVERIAARLARWLHEQPESDTGSPVRDLQARLAGKERHLLDAALAVAAEKGWIIELDGRYKPGTSMPA